MHGEAWTDERVDLLKRMWAAGESAATIGQRLGGLSRAAVLGKVFRLRLDGAGLKSPGKKEAARTGGAAEKSGPRHAPSSGGAALHAGKLKDSPLWRRDGARQREAREAREAREREEAASRRGKTLHELTNICCRWPYRRPGTPHYFFCGAPEADLERGLPYCPRHMARAYVAAPPAAVKPRRHVWRGF